MAQAKTIENNKSVIAFIKSATEKQKLSDCMQLLGIFEEASGFEPRMWGPAIVGFGKYHYKYESGHEGDMPLAAFSPRKNAITIYLDNFAEREELLQQFGKHKTSKACIYINKLEDISIPVLKKLIKVSIKHTKSKYK